jgi:hypothetical protein
LDSGTKTIAFESKKMKDAEMPAPKNFQITQVDLPILDKHGNPVRGAYLTAVDLNGLIDSIQKRTVLSGNQRLALNCLVAIEVKRASDGVQGFAAQVDYDEWRDSAKEHGMNARRFAESIKALVKKEMVLDRSGMYRSVPKPIEEGVAT